MPLILNFYTLKNIYAKGKILKIRHKNTKICIFNIVQIFAFLYDEF
jgi:hypothetical protein